MPYDSITSLATRIEALDAAIAKAELAQSTSVGDHSLTRANLADLYKQRDRLVSKYDSLEAASSGGRVGYVRFNRPLAGS